MSMELSSPLKRALFAIKDLQSKIERLEQGRNEPIAIIGMACRFPGDSSDPDIFWQMLREGRDAIEEVPPERWDINEYYDPDPAMPGKMSSRFGGFLKHIENFDAYFFKIAPREVLHIDPQQRLLLEVCCEALERAGQPIDASDGTRTGTFVSVAPSDYAQLQVNTGAPSLLDLYFTTGSVPGLAAGRLSYTLGWQGPSMVVDTACSSSLVAVHLACQSLRMGECDMAIAGGVNLILSPAGNIALSKAHMIAADGRCKTFDAAADGYIRSEGCGVVVLKRLADAQAQRDPILAVIRGSALNQDGRSASLTAPNGAAQEAVIRAALTQAGLKPEQIQYVEAHGTGTSLGDPIEIHALKRVLSKNRAADNPLLVGSVKANIGHTESAAGIASLMKAVLVLQHREVPPQLHFTTINPNILLDDAAITIPTKVVPLAPSQKQVYVGVSSFGISGTNAHMIVEGPPVQTTSTTTTGPAGEMCLLPLSARTNEGLYALVQAYQKLLTNDQLPPLFDICYTASARRAHYEHRLTIEAKTLAELSDQLSTFLAGQLSPALRTGQHIHGSQRKIAFVFPGQGSQWVGMAQNLLRHQPVFRAMIERCDQALRQFVPWSLIEVLQLPAAALEKSLWIEQVDIIQPAIFAIAVALAALWRSWGIEPDSVVGHSMGEIAAAHIAGILSLEDATRIICYRSQLLRRMRGQGAMAMVELSPEKAQEELRGYEESISVAAHNGPSSTVLAGSPEALEALLSTLQQREIFCRKINVNVASHCRQMDPLCDELRSMLQGIRPQRAQLSIISTVSGQPCDGEEMDETYWVQNLRQPVLFSEAIQQLISQDNTAIFLEISPHPVLLPAIKDCIQAVGKQASVLPSLHRNEDENTTLLRSLATCYVQGCAVNWQNVYGSQGHFTALPTYPWHYERYWITDHYPSAPLVPTRTGENFLLGTHLEDSVQNAPYYLQWLEQELVGAVPALHPDGPGLWLIFADQDAIGSHLNHHLALHGEQTIQVWPGPRFGMLESGRYQLNPAQPTEFQLLLNRVLATARSSCRGIIYLWSLKGVWQEHETLKTFEETILPDHSALSSLVQALVQQQWQHVPRLWVVTQDAQTPTPGPYLSLAQTPLAEIQRTIALEHPELHCTSIDLEKIEPETENAWAERLFKQCWHGTIDTQAQAETQIALRSNACFVARIQKRNVLDQSESGIDENWRKADEEKQRGLVEAYLVALTSRIFGYPATKLDTRQALNTLGLDSLMTLELTNCIQTDLGVTIPAIKILQGISIVQLVELIVEQARSHTALSQQADAATHTHGQKHLPAHLIAMQPLGSKPPFYCVHGAVGTVFGYVELSNILGAEQPFYGLQAPGLEGECEPLTTVEEMAASYIEAIRHIQPHGPYYLGGASFGGAVAFEMACMLHRQGEEIALLVLMDSGLPSMAKGSHVLGDIDSEDARILLHAVRAVNYYFEKELPITYEEVFQVPMAERIEYLLARTQNLWPAYVGVERTRNVFKIVRACWQSLLTYVPSLVYPQQVTFFRADGTVPEGLVEQDFHELSDDLPSNWSPFTALPLDIYDVSGNHATMIKKPHVYLLAEQLRFCLEAAQRRISGEKKC